MHCFFHNLNYIRKMDCLPENIKLDAESAISNLIPAKSKDHYDKEYSLFKNWKAGNSLGDSSEEVMLAYFAKKAQKYKSSSLWAQYSMIKTTMKVYEDVDIGKYYKLTAFLKRQHVGYEAKKSLTFSRDQIDKFLQTAPDDKFLAIKLVAVVAIAGGCRCDELVKMELKDVEVKEGLLLIHLPYTKTHKKRSFTILNKGFGINPLDLYRKYINLRPKNGKSTRLFLCYRGGKCTVQPIGVNSFGKMPAMIATFLKLENSNMYTGHAFRRSGTTLLADCGADVRTLKRFGWKSDAVVDGYIEDSLQNKVNIAQQVLGLKSSSNTVNQEFKVGCQKKELNLHDTPVSFNNNNCTINVNVYAHRT